MKGEGEEGTRCVLKRFTAAGSAGGGTASAGASQLRELRKTCHIMCKVQHPNVIQLQVRLKALARAFVFYFFASVPPFSV
jgi:hypothetical protein